MTELSEEQLNFIKKLYFYFGRGPIPSIHLTPFREEFKKLFPQKINHFHHILLDFGWITGRLSLNNRIFTEKFIQEVVGK